MQSLAPLAALACLEPSTVIGPLSRAERAQRRQAARAARAAIAGRSIAELWGNQAPPGELSERRQERHEEVTDRKAAQRQLSQRGKHAWRWERITVRANTKSEARARIKRRLGLDRLPPGANVATRPVGVKNLAGLRA